MTTLCIFSLALFSATTIRGDDKMLDIDTQPHETLNEQSHQPNTFSSFRKPYNHPGRLACLDRANESFLKGKWIMMGLITVGYILIFFFVWNSTSLSAEMRLAILLVATVVNFGFATLFFYKQYFRPIYVTLAAPIVCA